MATYVLVPGGAHGGWCYQKVARLLRAAGHEVYALTLTGVGERSHLVSPEVDLDLSREVFHEAATLLHNGLALDGLDDHDAESVVAGLCEDLVAPDPGAAIRARAEAVLEDPGNLHDPEGVSRVYLISAAIMKL